MTKVRWLTTQEEHAWRGYRRMRVLLDLQINRDLGRDADLSEADYDVLSGLTETPDRRLRVKDLAAQLMWSTSRLSHHVARMENRGLVSREETPADGRGAIVILTDDGWAAIRSAAPHHLASVREHFIDRLSPAELKALDSLAAKVTQHLIGAAELSSRTRG